MAHAVEFRLCLSCHKLRALAAGVWFCKVCRMAGAKLTQPRYQDGKQEVAVR